MSSKNKIKILDKIRTARKYGTAELLAPQNLTKEELSDVMKRRKAQKVNGPEYMKETREILDMKLEGKSPEEIGEAIKMHPANVVHRIRAFEKLLFPVEEVNQYKKQKSEILSSTEMKLMVAINDPERIASSSLKEVADTFKIVNEANRLEQNLSTSNISIRFTGEININDFKED